VKFSVEIFSKGQPNNVQYGGGEQLSVTEEEGIVIWKVISSG